MQLDLIFRVSDLAKLLRKLELAWRGNRVSEQASLRRELAELLGAIQGDAEPRGFRVHACDPAASMIPRDGDDAPEPVATCGGTNIESLVRSLTDSKRPLDRELFAGLSQLTRELCFDVTRTTHD